MKNLHDYIFESKKTYSFKVKVAGDFPECFVPNAKTALERYGCAKFEKLMSTPIQESPLDFPELKNMDVTIFECECEYPVSAQQILTHLIDNKCVCESHLRVRNIHEPTEQYQEELLEKEELHDTDSVALLTSPYENTGIKSKDYFGDDYNTSFLKDLNKVAKERKKELGQDVKFGTNKVDVLGTAHKQKGMQSPMSKIERD
jgi:hypothetical protein